MRYIYLVYSGLWISHPPASLKYPPMRKHPGDAEVCHYAFFIFPILRKHQRGYFSQKGCLRKGGGFGLKKISDFF